MDLMALGDLTTPWCLRVAVTLRLAEHMAAGHTTVDELATAAGCDRSALFAVLSHLASRGVFERVGPDGFGLGDAGRDLLEPSVRIGLDLDGFGGRMAHIWSGLLSAVRTGRPVHEEIFGRPFWDDLDAHPEVAESFDALMGPVGHGVPDPHIEITGGWAGIRTVVDVGGGTGTLLAEVLRARPAVRGTLVDLPRTVARSAEVFAAAGVADRASAVGQSFLDPLPAGADLYLMKSVLNDWPDREAVALLRRCAEAARPDGRLIVLSGVSAQSPDGGGELLMLLLVGGKQRGLAEFEALAADAGLVVTAAAPQPSWRFVVECRPTPAPPT